MRKTERQLVCGNYNCQKVFYAVNIRKYCCAECYHGDPDGHMNKRPLRITQENCTKCGIALVSAYTTSKNNRERVLNNRLNNPRKALFDSAKSRANSRGCELEML